MKKLLSLLFVLLLILFFFPTLLSLSPALAGRLFSWKTGGSWDIKSLSLSWTGPQVIGPTRYSSDLFNAGFEKLQLNVPLWKLARSPAEGSAELDEGTFVFPPSATLSHVSANIATLPMGGYSVLITGATQILDAQGSFGVKGTYTSWNPPQFNLEAGAQRLPGEALDLACKAFGIESKGRFKGLVGDRVDFVAASEMHGEEGRIDLSVVTTLSALELHGDIRNRRIYLRDQLTAWFPLNEHLSETALKDLNPLFLTALQSKGPTRLEIRPQNAVLPFDPFEWSQVEIEEGLLDLGQVTCKNGSTLATLVGLAKYKLPVSVQEMNVWFTPLYFSVHQGKVKTMRLDALVANSLHICTWGTLDLVKDRISMIVGLPADTLEKVFGLKGLPPSYVLKMPLKGSSRHPKLEAGPALARIAAMKAAERAPGGGFFGGALGTLAQPEADADTPPPTTRPYPWETPAR